MEQPYILHNAISVGIELAQIDSNKLCLHRKEQKDIDCGKKP